MMLLAKNIRTLRKEHNMSQNELAQKLHKKSYTTIQKWESGVSEPSVSDVYRMAKLFDVSMSEMISADIDSITNEEKELLDVFKILSVPNRIRLLEFANSMAKLQAGDEIVFRARDAIEREKMA